EDKAQAVSFFGSCTRVLLAVPEPVNQTWAYAATDVLSTSALAYRAEDQCELGPSWTPPIELYRWSSRIAIVDWHTRERIRRLLRDNELELTRKPRPVTTEPK